MFPFPHTITTKLSIHFNDILLPVGAILYRDRTSSIRDIHLPQIRFIFFFFQLPNPYFAMITLSNVNSVWFLGEFFAFPWQFATPERNDWLYSSVKVHFHRGKCTVWESEKSTIPHSWSSFFSFGEAHVPSLWVGWNREFKIITCYQNHEEAPSVPALFTGYRRHLGHRFCHKRQRKVGNWLQLTKIERATLRPRFEEVPEQPPRAKFYQRMQDILQMTRWRQSSRHS